MKKHHYNKIEKSFEEIFKTEVTSEHQSALFSHFDSIKTVVREPIVKQQIIQLAKLCQEVPNNLTIRSTLDGVYIEFW
ncbi:hypothetical protein [Hyunsoonleella pacifica]|uniref:Uncharacterized protein n=1 Tax=Hyunsoonleella pacifica TaxID=1080224 RepID=A0A4Q9FME5_9FLAO|nr:hypothetical protein [Hyunsoonleella pacifica]TBN12485.1 hypothetical protein EYD46_17360 [Hyunsoonleella pacifica]GGD29109.1 hypothetical protein GCM10011368_33850 [Hyunsoonleella pacifica]